MITLTPTAAQEVKRLVEKEQKPNVGLRVGIKGGGCSGMTYILSIDEATPKQYDTVFEQDGIKILIDAKSHLYLDGTTIDFKNSLMGGGFEFQNPLAKKSCGCGTSFSV
ncbi:MAG: iron-sulfur cluster assembly accessory protein [Candidatus Omnitrophica bacterium]|nr:iron-sulfur cluster assembly accessory protein [Candidatus Omnitrophota bacterium]MBI3082757.1 iron-sulfur cluster assembly accessory protein [Candidatus Omnitrophota bacterium]